jgi:hypothetical protein
MGLLLFGGSSWERRRPAQCARARDIGKSCTKNTILKDSITELRHRGHRGMRHLWIVLGALASSPADVCASASPSVCSVSELRALCVAASGFATISEN